MSDKMLKVKKTVDDIWPMANKKVLVRVDFNVPIKGGVIRSDLRIRAAVPTIRRIVENGGICILMSHLGRPKGVKYSDVAASEDYRRRHLQTWALEAGTGKTTFFAFLSGTDKKAVLAKSSVADKAKGLSEKENSGKTYLFSQLPEAEKAELLEGHVDRLRQETQFPQLRQYGGFEEELSLKPVAKKLEEIMGQPVAFAEDCLDAEAQVKRLRPGDILLLENVRFYSDESSKDPTERRLMAEKLASYADYFVSDAFGTAHRDSATMTGLAQVMGHGAAGYLMAREITYFAKVLGEPGRPMVAIVGGAKVSDKIMLLENMLTRIDKLIIGGAMAYTFLKAQGRDIGKSFCEAGQSFTDKYGEKVDIVSLAGALLKKAEERKVDVYLPVDHVCHTECKTTDKPLITEDANVPSDYMALDIGPKTIKLYEAAMAQCKTCIWNGPMGVFEIAPYHTGTYAIAKQMAALTKTSGMLSIIGGGDSASAAEKSGYESGMSHVSTGGGASLELLEGKELPGIKVLDDK
jgi:phosphoglycerate kinase